MATQPIAGFDVIATFGSAAQARTAGDALDAAGMRIVRISAPIGIGRGTSASRNEGSFFTRVVLVIVLWSVIGTAVGAGIGWAVAALIDTGGTAALLLQIISWAIFGHLIAGIWAGYVLLADRSQREFAPGTAADAATVTVRCANREEIARARAALSSAGATSIRESVRYG